MEMMRLATELAPYSNPATYDRTAVLNVLKNKFIEPAIRPYTYVEVGDKQYHTGGRSVLMQPFNKTQQTKKWIDGKRYILPGSEDLDPSIIKNGNLVQRGQVYLPHNFRNKPIKVGERGDFKVWANVNKDGKLGVKNDIVEANKDFLSKISGLNPKSMASL